MEKVTNLSVEKFYQTYKDSVDNCLETPRDQW